MPRNSRGAFDGAGTQIGVIGTRIVRAWNALDADRRLACAAAGLLLISMFMPWYQQNAVLASGQPAPLVSRNLSAFAVFSFIEAFVLISAVGVLVLLFVRAERRGVRLPASDGTVILVAGGWSGLLLIYRLFDKPGISTRGVAANVGIQWGIFFALLAAGLLLYAGSRIRSPPARRLAWAARGTRFEGFGPASPRGPVEPDVVEEPPPDPAEHEPTVLLARDTRRRILLPREVDATVRFAPEDPPRTPRPADVDATVRLAGEERTVARDVEDPTTRLATEGEDETVRVAEEDRTVRLSQEDETIRLGGEDPTVNRQLSFEDAHGEAGERPDGPRTAAGRRARG